MALTRGDLQMAQCLWNDEVIGPLTGAFNLLVARPTECTRTAAILVMHPTGKSKDGLTTCPTWPMEGNWVVKKSRQNITKWDGLRWTWTQPTKTSRKMSKSAC